MLVDQNIREMARGNRVGKRFRYAGWKRVLFSFVCDGDGPHGLTKLSFVIGKGRFLFVQLRLLMQ